MTITLRDLFVIILGMGMGAVLTLVWGMFMIIKGRM